MGSDLFAVYRQDADGPTLVAVRASEADVDAAILARVVAATAADPAGLINLKTLAALREFYKADLGRMAVEARRYSIARIG